MYPVTEDHKGADSLMGSAMKGGHNAHYIVTKKDGKCIQSPQRGENYNELVLKFCLQN